MFYFTALKTLLSLGLTAAITVGLLSAAGCQSMPKESSAAAPETSVNANTAALVKNLSLVDENHYVMSVGAGKYTATYVLDSYIIPFEQPYYILVRQQNGKPFSKHAATVVALDYIQPRGCTQPLQRLEDLDKQNADGSAYLIGVAC